MIPKILIQSTRDEIPEYVQKMLKKQMSSEWVHLIFNDADSINFFKDNPLEEFPNIIDVFNSFNGAHKSDIFRYYYTYINGGVFLDDDAMLYCSLDDLISDCDCFFTYAQKHFNKDLVFNGFYGVEPRNDIIYELLRHAYHTHPSRLDNIVNDAIKYLYFCEVAYKVCKKYKSKYTVKEFKETYVVDNQRSMIFHNNKLIFEHYCVDKIIPTDI
jgi:mannosyltransferase OCH1-like enzyme